MTTTQFKIGRQSKRIARGQHACAAKFQHVVKVQVPNSHPATGGKSFRKIF
jgi:hypothetical protein